MGIGFGVDTAPALVCGYVVATLFAMISVTPQGVGVVEAAVVVAFTSFGESAAAGTAIGLVYRGIVFWMPFIIGAVLINTTKAFKGDVKQAHTTRTWELSPARPLLRRACRKRRTPTPCVSSARLRCVRVWRVRPVRMRRMARSRPQVRCRKVALRWRVPLLRRYLLRRALSPHLPPIRCLLRKESGPSVLA